MSRKTLNKIEELMKEFNRVTGRPPRAYEPEEDRIGGKANIGYAYVRCLGEQDDSRYSAGAIINHGGGLIHIPGLTYLKPGDLLRALRSKLEDPEWVRLNQFEHPDEESDECSSCGGEIGDDGYEDLCGDCAEHQIGKTAERGMKTNPKPDITDGTAQPTQ